MEYKLMNTAFETKNYDVLQHVYEYAIEDVLVLQRLCNKCDIIVRHVQFAKLMNQPIINGFFKTDAAQLCMYMTPLFKNIPKITFDGEFRGYQGAINYLYNTSPETDKPMNNVQPFDVMSLYPSIMLGYNMCANTFLGAYKERQNIDNAWEIDINDNKNPDIKYIYFHKTKHSFVCEQINKFLKIKKENTGKGDPNTRQAAKIVINTLYGVFGDKNGPLFNPYISLAVTAASRNIMNYVQEYCREINVEYLFVDTDSIYIRNAHTEMAQVLDACVKNKFQITTIHFEAEHPMNMFYIPMNTKKCYIYSTLSTPPTSFEEIQTINLDNIHATSFNWDRLNETTTKYFKLFMTCVLYLDNKYYMFEHILEMLFNHLKTCNLKDIAIRKKTISKEVYCQRIINKYPEL